MTIASTLKNSKSYQVFKKWYFWVFIVFVIYVLFFWKPNREKYPVVQHNSNSIPCSDCGKRPPHDRHNCMLNCY